MCDCFWQRMCPMLRSTLVVELRVGYPCVGGAWRGRGLALREGGFDGPVPMAALSRAM